MILAIRAFHLCRTQMWTALDRVESVNSVDRADFKKGVRMFWRKRETKQKKTID